MNAKQAVTFSDLIRLRMDALGLTQDELADMTGISQQTISKYISAKIATPRGNHIRPLARALRVEDSELLDAIEQGNATLN